MSSVPQDTESQPCSKLEEPTQNEEIECSVCLLTAVHPVKLPCSHIFCYLCVKGIANRSKKCALCRQEISPQFLIKPNLVKTEDLDKEVAFEDGYQWFYEGNRGWWQYDERTSQELENTFKAEKDKKLEILIAGFLYVIDFENMIQYRRNDPNRRRRIKRDLIGIPKKGIAGLRVKKPVLNVPDRREGDGGDTEEISVNTQSTAAVVAQTQNTVQNNDSNSSGSINTNTQVTDTQVTDTDRLNRNASTSVDLMGNSISNRNEPEILHYVEVHNDSSETSTESAEVENSNNEVGSSLSSTMAGLRLTDDEEGQTVLSNIKSS